MIKKPDKLLDYNARRYDSMLTDVFDLHLKEVLELENPSSHRRQMLQVPILQFKLHPSHSVSVLRSELLI